MVSTHHAGQLPRRVRLRLINLACSNKLKKALPVFLQGSQNEFIIPSPLAKMCSYLLLRQGTPCLHQKRVIHTGQMRWTRPAVPPPTSNPGLGQSNAWKILTTTGSPPLGSMGVLISCLSGAFGGKTLSGSSPVLERAKLKISPTTFAAPSVRTKRAR